MNLLHEQRLHSIATALRMNSRNLKQSDTPIEADPAIRFVTISRQAGTGGKRLGEHLASALNQADPANEPWCAWDRELVHKVAAEHRIPSDCVDALEDSGHSWFKDFLAAFSSADQPEEFKVYRRVAMTVRALAKARHAIIVGRGGVFITAGLPGGLHIRLIAPFESRVRQMSERLNVSLDDAATKVCEIDHNREAFYRRYWPSVRMTPETFAITLNTAVLSEQQMLDCLMPLVLGNETEKSRSLSRSRVPHFASAGHSGAA